MQPPNLSGYYPSRALHLLSKISFYVGQRLLLQRRRGLQLIVLLPP